MHTDRIKRDAPVSIERLHELLRYDHGTGTLFWRVSRGGVRAGDVAGCSNTSDGYIDIVIEGRRYAAHRIAWAVAVGNWPPSQLDHVNGLRHDNRAANLRCVTAAVNAQNRSGPQANNRSGYLGVAPTGRKWRAVIHVSGKQHHLGTYETPRIAAVVRALAARLYHPGSPAIARQLEALGLGHISLVLPQFGS